MGAALIVISGRVDDRAIHGAGMAVDTVKAARWR